MAEQLPVDPSVRTRRDPWRRVTPAVLWDAVVAARASLAHERHQRQNQREPAARGELVEALEAYASSLEERGHPIPYTLRDELRLQRLAIATGGRGRP